MDSIKQEVEGQVIDMDCADDGNNSAAQNVSRRAQTAAEKLREKKLREDAMALVCDSRLVQCRRCGAKIKLSLKSAFDPCHWQKHRVRCLRRPDTIVHGLKLENEKIYSRAAKNAKPAQPPRQAYSPPAAPPADSESMRASITPPPSPSPSVPTLHDDSASDAPSSPATSPIHTSFPEYGRLPIRQSSPSPPPCSPSPPPQSPPPPRTKRTPRSLTLEGWPHTHALDMSTLWRNSRSWYTGHNPAMGQHDDTVVVYGGEDWCLEPWRPITFQESGVRFTPL